ncbi:TolC family protein [Mesocricetibacter intestinalis]|nr:TolC family protein [Mesocricetibacter intestinalis]
MRKQVSTALLVGSLLFSTQSVSAKVSLQQILRNAFVADPTLDEAKANINMAQSQTEVSKAGHYPVVSLTGTSVLDQKHVYTSERRSGPGVVARVNLYAWGGIEAEVERDKAKEGYYQHKLNETQETLGQQVGELYLAALRAKENIAIYKESLVRHEKILRDLRTIADYDEGRYSEVNEALSRRNQVESTILMQERILHASLNRLSRYSYKVLRPEDLSDPFAGTSASNFVRRYKNPDLKNSPTYLAQQKEFESAQAAVKASKAKRLPAINLEGNANRREHEVYINMSWDIYNPATKYEEQQNYYSQKAAEAKLREIELEMQEKALTSEADMLRNQQLMAVTKKQIALQRNVVQDNELKFSVADKSLIDLLNSYQELTSVQAAEVTARNDYRDAALVYLISQARITNWVGTNSNNFQKINK